MKFKNYIETESGIKDTSTSPGTAGQLLSSTVAGTSWIDQNTISSGTSEVVDIQVKNISSADGGINLSKGDPVYIYGSVGASPRLYIDLADADSTATNNLGDGKMPCVGLLDQDLTPNQEGTATVVGKLRNLITNPIGVDIPNENDTVYVKSGGGLTLTKPTGSTNLIQNVGQVGRVSTSADGNIVVAALLRSNDVPNLTTGKIWVGSAANTIESATVHLDETNERMGIGTNNPQEPLHIYSTGAGPVRVEIESTQAADSTLQYSNSVRSYATLLTQSGQFSIYDYNAASHRFYMLTNGNIGIGTTTANSLLEVAGGEIDSTGGDGYRINGKPWAAESSNILRLGDWDGEGFSTSIFDENTVEIFKVKDGGAIINCDRTSTTTYGSDASLVVGGNKFSPYGAGVLTLLNNDPISQAGDSTGLIQFAIRDDQSTSAGYTSASIKGSIDFAAGTGSSGGGVLDFLTSTGGLGSSPTTRMRIDKLGNVGIGTTSPGEKLVVNGVVKATASTDAYKGYIKQTITSSANEKADNADYNLIPYNTLTTVSSDQSYNRMVAAYDGRIKKVYIRNTSGTPTADTVNFKKQVNNTTSSTVYSATVANAGSAGMSAVYNFADSDFTFNEGDTFGILYQTVNSAGGARKMAGVAINVIVEYNIT